MGATYCNIVLKGTEQTPVVEFLSELGQTAYVSSKTNDYVIVWPNEKQAALSIGCLVALLSQKLDCVAWAVSVYDDKDMIYELHCSGMLTDTYDSFPIAPNDELELHPVERPPKGGDAKKLCTAFKVVSVVDRVHGILHNAPSDEDKKPEDMLPLELAEAMKAKFGADIFTRTKQRRITKPYVFEQDRHKALGTALGIPDAIGGVDFEFVMDSREDGEITDEVGLAIAFVKCKKPMKAKEFYLVRVPDEANLEQDIVEPLIMDADLVYKYPIGGKVGVLAQISHALLSTPLVTDTYFRLKTVDRTVEINLGANDPVNFVRLSISGKGASQFVKSVCATTGWRAFATSRRGFTGWFA